MAIGDILSVEIDSSGWFALIKIEGLSIGGTYLSGISNGNNRLTAPKLTINVTTPGFDDDGLATTIAYTVYGTKYKRKIYPDQAEADETIDGSDVIVRIALSDWIFTGATATAEVLSDLYTQGGNGSNAATGVVVTNSSIEAVPKVIGNWTVADRDIVQDGFVLSCVAFHRSMREGRPVRGVTFSVEDENANVFTETVNEPVSVQQTESGLYVSEYRTIVDTTLLVDGDTLDCNFRAFPWYGVEASCLNTDDGVNVYPNKKYTKRQFKLDKIHTAYGRAVAVVDPTGAGASPTVVDYTTFNPVTPPDAYGTIYEAINAIVAFNTSNFGRANCSGGIIYLMEGNHNWTGGTNTAGTTEFMLTIEGYPGSTRDNVQITAVSGDNDAGNHTKFKSIYINTTAVVFTEELFTIYEYCRLNFYGSAFMYTANSYNFILHCTVDATHVHLGHYSVNYDMALLVRGCIVADGFDGRIDNICAIGNKFLGYAGTNEAVYHTTEQIDNAIFCFNFMIHRDGAGYGFRSLGSTATTPIQHGLAILQNVFERATAGGPNSTPLVQIAADQSPQLDGNNIIFVNNTCVGQRVNYAYNDYNLNGVGPAWRKFWLIQNSIFHDWNIVTDKDSHGGTPSPERYGNLSLVHGVGTGGNICSDEIGTASFNPEFSGINSIDPDPGIISLDFIEDKSSGINGDGLGGGNYEIQNSSDAINISFYWCLSNDIIDRNRRQIDDPGAITRNIRLLLGDVFSQNATSDGELKLIIQLIGNVISQPATSSGIIEIATLIRGDVICQNATSIGELLQRVKIIYKGAVKWRT